MSNPFPSSLPGSSSRLELCSPPSPRLYPRSPAPAHYLVISHTLRAKELFRKRLHLWLSTPGSQLTSPVPTSADLPPPQGPPASAPVAASCPETPPSLWVGCALRVQLLFQGASPSTPPLCAPPHTPNFRPLCCHHRTFLKLKSSSSWSACFFSLLS